LNCIYVCEIRFITLMVSTLGSEPPFNIIQQLQLPVGDNIRKYYRQFDLPKPSIQALTVYTH